MSPEVYSFFDAKLVQNTLEIVTTARQIRHPEPAQTFRDEVFEAVEKYHPTNVLIDLGVTSFLGSSMFAVLISLKQAFDKRELPLYLCSLHPEVQLAASIVGLAKVIPVFENAHEAYRSINP